MASLDTRYIDVKDSILRNSVVGDNVKPFSATDPKNQYRLVNPNDIKLKYYANPNDVTNMDVMRGSVFSVANQAGLHGYMNPYSPELSVGCD